ncbi:hypothetical protein F5882DRAFT_402903 [Hyaloscypha sp. PMI_1271]|nr:hypothetical protein F5882DRAFT_402903 [Hyaloscypha sp. PMI_1271]
MLRPMDIISLIKSTGLCTTPLERRTYLIWWRQMFFDMKWVSVLKEQHCTVTIMGNDQRRLDEALRTGDCRLDANKLKLIVVIGELQEPKRTSRSYEHSRSIINSFDTRVTWHQVPANPSSGCPFKIRQRADDVQTCVISVIQDTCTDLDYSWSRLVSEHRGALAKSLIGPGKPYPSSYTVWETEWQQLETDRLAGSHNSTHVHYIINPLQFHKYAMRIFVNSAGVCCAVFMLM